MSAERVTYLDSSAIVKLAVEEPESAALRRYLRQRRPLVSSALARAEVARALLPLGEAGLRRGGDVLSRLELIRINDRILTVAGSLLPADLRTLDAIHLATAQQLEGDLARLITYDERMSAAAENDRLASGRPKLESLYTLAARRRGTRPPEFSASRCLASDHARVTGSPRRIAPPAITSA